MKEKTKVWYGDAQIPGSSIWVRAASGEKVMVKGTFTEEGETFVEYGTQTGITKQLAERAAFLRVFTRKVDANLPNKGETWTNRSFEQFMVVSADTMYVVVAPRLASGSAELQRPQVYTQQQFLEQFTEGVKHKPLPEMRGERRPVFVPVWEGSAGTDIRNDFVNRGQVYTSINAILAEKPHRCVGFLKVPLDWSKVEWADIPTTPTLEDNRPHSRACGIRKHDHGPDCAKDCPTCRSNPADAFLTNVRVSDSLQPSGIEAEPQPPQRGRFRCSCGSTTSCRPGHCVNVPA